MYSLCAWLCVVVNVRGVSVTQLRDVVYIVTQWSSTVVRFSATTHQRLTDINVKDLSSPWDVAACQQTSRLYVTDDWQSIWRVSSNAEDILRWPPESPSDRFEPYKLSVTSTRLLVTSRNTRQLIQFDAAGQELKRVQLSYYMEPQHAVESPAGTFIVGHGSYTRLFQKLCQVSEVNTEGQVLRQFSRPLGDTRHIAVDSQGNIFVADCDSRRILLLDCHLALRRVIIDEHQLNFEEPRRLCYHEQSGRLLVTFYRSDSVAVFDVLRR